jgi:hypothetical protein
MALQRTFFALSELNLSCLTRAATKHIQPARFAEAGFISRPRSFLAP